MMNALQWKKNLVIVRGGGDIATGTIARLYQCGFPLLILETANPSCIRRTISFCEAVTESEMMVEGMKAKKAASLEEAYEIYQQGGIPLMVDEEGLLIGAVHPAVVVDAILAKKNLGTKITDAPIVIGLGPGFTAGKDVHAVIETKRGHDLGRVIYEGTAIANTGVPGIIGGYGKERVIHAPVSGRWHGRKNIGEIVEKGEVLARVDEHPVTATISGVLRGMIREGYPVEKGLKVADIDPRIAEKGNCYRISDKARCVAGGVLEAILHLEKRQS